MALGTDPMASSQNLRVGRMVDRLLLLDNRQILDFGKRRSVNAARGFLQLLQATCLTVFSMRAFLLL